MAEPHIQRIYDGEDSPCAPAEAVGEHLRPGETLIWAGRPATFTLRPANGLIFVGGIFMLISGGFTLGFGLYDLVAEGAFDDWVRFAQALLFVALGLIFLGSSVGLALRGAWTVYAITDQRAMIITHFLRRRVRSFAAEDLDEPLRIDRDEGYGHLIFAKHKKNLLLQDKDRSRYVGIGFFRVRDVAAVEAELVKLRARAGVAAEIDPALKPA